MVEITGVHPYADKFPMLPESELQELAESIRANGLRNPIVVTPDGLILDGRNRTAACALADVEPATVMYEGEDYAEYVIDCNSSRRHMTTGARAMSTALVLAADGRRGDGRWRRGTVDITESGNSDQRWRNALNQAGTVLDYAEPLALEVIDGHVALDAAYRTACEARDAERQKLEAEERIAAEEADAKTFVEQTAPDLAAQVGDVFQTYAEARVIWEQRNREEAARLAAEKKAREDEERARRQSRTDRYTAICQAMLTASTWSEQYRGDIDALMAEYAEHELNPPQAARYLELKHLHHAKALVDGLIAWKEAQ
ncbi:ParB N-terminal domain-containing protein [Gordonia sp. (in: high G+C Gram-positive bacteria)]|uniref:ParB N-terminal domain-containing protein n=1 Tax=Gordonia sp. (in: high G+C Gram-positive bacteria) TaxID=84139 RepID=UPI0039E457AB